MSVCAAFAGSGMVARCRRCLLLRQLLLLLLLLRLLPGAVRAASCCCCCCACCQPTHAASVLHNAHTNTHTHVACLGDLRVETPTHTHPNTHRHTHLVGGGVGWLVQVDAAVRHIILEGAPQGGVAGWDGRVVACAQHQTDTRGHRTASRRIKREREDWPSSARRAPSLPPCTPNGQEARQLAATPGALGLLSWSYKRVTMWAGRLLGGDPLINQEPPHCAGAGAVSQLETCNGCHGPWLTPAAAMKAAGMLPRAARTVPRASSCAPWVPAAASQRVAPVRTLSLS